MEGFLIHFGLVKIAELPGVGAVTDIEGRYRIELDKTGRYTIEGQYVGYEPSVMKEVLVAGSKEVVLDISLRENSRELSNHVRNIFVRDAKARSVRGNF